MPITPPRLQDAPHLRERRKWSGQVLQDCAREGRVEGGVRAWQLIDGRHVKRDV